MTPGMVLAVAGAINVVSVVLLVLIARERRRIERMRRRSGVVPLTAGRVDEATRRLRP